MVNESIQWLNQWINELINEWINQNTNERNANQSHRCDHHSIFQFNYQTYTQISAICWQLDRMWHNYKLWHKQAPTRLASINTHRHKTKKERRREGEKDGKRTQTKKICTLARTVIIYSMSLMRIQLWQLSNGFSVCVY